LLGRVGDVQSSPLSPFYDIALQEPPSSLIETITKMLHALFRWSLLGEIVIETLFFLLFDDEGFFFSALFSHLCDSGREFGFFMVLLFS